MKPLLSNRSRAAGAAATFALACVGILSAGCNKDGAATDAATAVTTPQTAAKVPATVPAEAQSAVQQGIQHGQQDGKAYAEQMKARAAQSGKK